MKQSMRIYVTLLCVCVLSLAACSFGNSATTRFGFFVDLPIVTTNAATTVGSSTGSYALSERLYPGMYIQGPSGQLVPNVDLGTAQALPGAQRQVIYTISDTAVFSDGVPVTCDDFLLSYVAGAHPDLFHSHIPLMQQVEHVDCTEGSKTFTVVFREGFGGRWRYLFGSGEVLPAHVVAKKAGLTTSQMYEALNASDSADLAAIADVWAQGFTLGDAYDPDMQVSFGPLRLSSLGDDGEIILAPNDYYSGESVGLEEIAVWDSTHRDMLDTLASDGRIKVAEFASAAPAWATNKKSSYSVMTDVGRMVDSLIPATAGIMADPVARGALASCIKNDEVAQVSSEYGGVEVPPVYAHLSDGSASDQSLLETIGKTHISDYSSDVHLLAGQQLVIGYAGVSERLAAMIASLAETCASVGVDIQAAESMTMDDLKGMTDGTGSLDLFLAPIDFHREFPSVESNDLGGVDVKEQATLQKDEEDLWSELPTIPLSAQPRTVVAEKDVSNVVMNTSRSGVSWNMDRWRVH